MMMNNNNNNNKDIFFDDWEDSFVDQVIQSEELILSSMAKPSSNPSSFPPPLQITTTSRLPQQQPLRLDEISFSSFSPPRELSQKTTTNLFDSPPRPPKPRSDNKDLEIERLKRELGQASKQIANLEKECLKLKKERDKKEDLPEFVSSKNEEENAHAKCSKSINKNFGNLAANYHKTSSKFQNGVPSKELTVGKTFKDKGIETDMVSHQEAQNSLTDDRPAYLDLSQKLLAVWGSPTDKKMGSNAISKLLVCCQRDFHILFGCMSMNLPSEITRELLKDLSSSGPALDYLNDRFHTPEAAKVSHFYVVLTKIADGTDVLEILIEPLLDLCVMKNVVIVHSSICILHTLLKLLLESGKDFGKRENIFIEELCNRKNREDSGGLESVKDGELFNEEITRKECWNHQSSLQPHVNWINLFEIMHQIAMRVSEESVRVEAVSIMKLLLLRSNAYLEREQFCQKIVFKTISELLKKDVGLLVKKHALRLLYLALNCPKVFATFCHGCKEGDGNGGADGNASASDFQNLKIILQGLADCVVSRGGGLVELKVSRNAIVVVAFLASSGQPGFEILVGHKLCTRGVNYLMLILQLLVSEMDQEAGAHDELPEIFRERTYLMREILILLNRLVSSPSYSATVLRGLTSTRYTAGLTIDIASRLSQKGRKIEQQDNMAKHVRETEIVDLARLFKKRVFTYLGDDLL